MDMCLNLHVNICRRSWRSNVHFNRLSTLIHVDAGRQPPYCPFLEISLSCGPESRVCLQISTTLYEPSLDTGPDTTIADRFAVFITRAFFSSCHYVKRTCHMLRIDVFSLSTSKIVFANRSMNYNWIQWCKFRLNFSISSSNTSILRKPRFEGCSKPIIKNVHRKSVTSENNIYLLYHKKFW